jgi:hypothetical protein
LCSCAIDALFFCELTFSILRNESLPSLRSTIVSIILSWHAEQSDFSSK